ncbi:MAG: hypothetical protein H6551_12725 [Chitinophagales bacterium]|nr:hypothetical protein [Chitinophagaceae bacterium]MCB9065996.1 hypothetical protein [Chitinophagales bacterium]
MKKYLTRTLYVFVIAIGVDLLFNALGWSDDAIEDSFKLNNLLQWLVFALLMALPMMSTAKREKKD